MDNPNIQQIPLHQLELSNHNARRTPPGGTADLELKASIAAHGLLENLVVQSTPDSHQYQVIAGGRRLKALQELFDDDVITFDHPVPCLVTTEDTAGSEISLAENVIRAEMHPADQVETFVKLIEMGNTPSNIAHRFGLAQSTVEKYLRLGTVSPTIMNAYREGECNMAMVMAFASTTDQTLQEQAWLQLSESYFDISEHRIRRILETNRTNGNTSLAQFVGIGDYEAAGGRVTRDLFAEHDNQGVWLEDQELLDTLAKQKLQALVDERAADWKWVDYDLNFDWTTRNSFDRIQPGKSNPTEEEKTELAAIETRTAELDSAVDGANEDESSWTDEDGQEFDKLSKRYHDIEEQIDSRREFTPEQRALAGAIVTIERGEAKWHQGLVRPADNKAANQLNKQAAAATASANGLQTSDEKRYSGPLTEDLRDIRANIIRSHLAGSFENTFDLLTFQLVRELFTSESYYSRAIDLRIDDRHYPNPRSKEEHFQRVDLGKQQLTQQQDQLPLDWLNAETRALAFEQMCALSIEDKQRLFAACVARIMIGKLTTDRSTVTEIETVVARLKIDFAKHFRPDAAFMWKRIRKDDLLQIAQETLGEDWANAHRKDKKGELTQAMETAFAAGEEQPNGLTAEARTAALKWTPLGFAAFPQSDNSAAEMPEEYTR